jgi:hypothetical protein
LAEPLSRRIYSDTVDVTSPSPSCIQPSATLAQSHYLPASISNTTLVYVKTVEQFRIVEVPESARFELLLTFGQPIRYNDLKRRIPKGLRCSKKGIVAMPKKKKTARTTRQGLADYERRRKAYKKLVLELEKASKKLEMFNFPDKPYGPKCK